jgi:hypothetical protein
MVDSRIVVVSVVMDVEQGFVVGKAKGHSADWWLHILAFAGWFLRLICRALRRVRTIGLVELTC